MGYFKQLVDVYMDGYSTNDVFTVNADGNLIPQAISEIVDVTDLSGAELVAAPAAADSTGTAGQIAYENGYFYVCVATDTWQRVAIATWGE